MSEAKIKIKIGSIEFYGEGEHSWLEKQLDKMIVKAPELLKVAPLVVPAAKPSTLISNSNDGDPMIAKKPLGTFLQEKNATIIQNRKFLATAIWLDAKGKSRLKTSDITKALSDGSQKKLNNPSLNLIAHVKQGNCEKEGDQFYVTDEGRKAL